MRVEDREKKVSTVLAVSRFRFADRIALFALHMHDHLQLSSHIALNSGVKLSTLPLTYLL